MALPASNRLKNREAFVKIRKSGSDFRRPGFAIKTAENNGEGKRFAVSVTKSAGNAVTRNRIKRVVSEWVRNHIENFPNGRDYQFIISGLPVDGIGVFKKYLGEFIRGFDTDG